MLSIIKSLIEDFIMIPSFNVVILGTQQTGKTVFFKSINSLATFQPDKKLPQLIIISNILQLHIHPHRRIKQYHFLFKIDSNKFQNKLSKTLRMGFRGKEDDKEDMVKLLPLITRYHILCRQQTRDCPSIKSLHTKYFYMIIKIE